MFTPPEDLSEGQIRGELAAGWNFAAETLSYLPVGFGAHHWRAADAAGRQLFLIVHDLPRMLRSRADTAEAALGRLESAFGCALSLRRDAGLEFVVAPVPTLSGQVVRRLPGRYSLAVCPFLTGCEPGHDGGFPAADRPAVVRLLTELHQAAPAAAPLRCDFGLQNADGLRAAIEGTGEPWRTGPYGERARALLARHAAGVIALMAAYRELAAAARARPERFVVTHGEPDPRNVLKTPAGFAIVDWDFVQLAPPERDLWDLAETDRSVLAAYTQATGSAIDSGALALFRMWYDLSEIADYLELFRVAHHDTEDTAESWKNLEYYLRPAERWPQLRLPAPDGMQDLPGPGLAGNTALTCAPAWPRQVSPSVTSPGNRRRAPSRQSGRQSESPLGPPSCDRMVKSAHADRRYRHARRELQHPGQSFVPAWSEAFIRGPSRVRPAARSSSGWQRRRRAMP